MAGSCLNVNAPVIVDMAGATFAKRRTPVIADHDPERRIGHTTDQTIGRQILAKGIISVPTKDAAEFDAGLRAGFPFQISIGADVTEAEAVEEGESVHVNGKTWPGPLVVTRQPTINELSVTTFGSDGNTSATLAASLLHKGKDAMTTADLEKSRELRATEVERVDGIIAASQTAATENDVSLVEFDNGKTISLADAKAHAIRSGMSLDKFELACHRSAMTPPEGSGPAIHTQPAGAMGHSSSGNGDLIQGILLCRAGYEKVAEKTLGAETMEAANKMWHTSLVDLCRMTLQASGAVPPSSRTEMVTRALQASAQSAISMVVALGSSMDKMLGYTFQEAPATWRSICAVRDLANFRDHTAISSVHGTPLEKQGPDGSCALGSMVENTTAFKADTYGKMFALGRKNSINDDLSVCDDIGRVFTSQAMRKVSDVIYETLMANASSHFHADNGNLTTGAAFSKTELEAMVKSMRKQRDDEDNDLDIAPQVFIVPPEIEVTAREVLKSVETNRTGDNTPTDNAMRDIATLEVESRLSNTAKFANASLTASYLFAGPHAAPIYVGVLEGMQSPRVDMFGLNSDPEWLGIKWRVYIDFGCGLGEKAAGVKSDGV